MCDYAYFSEEVFNWHWLPEGTMDNTEIPLVMGWQALKSSLKSDNNKIPD